MEKSHRKHKTKMMMIICQCEPLESLHSVVVYLCSPKIRGQVNFEGRILKRRGECNKMDCDDYLDDYNENKDAFSELVTIEHHDKNNQVDDYIDAKSCVMNKNLI